MRKFWNTFQTFPGTPRTTAETYEEALKYGKQIKRESPPIRSFEGGIGKGKPYEGVNTIKEMGRSIHEIPRQDQSGQDICKTPDLSDRRVMEGSISQVWWFEFWSTSQTCFMDIVYYCHSLDLLSEHIAILMSFILKVYFTFC